MKTFQQLIDMVPEDVTYDRGFELVDAILCSENAKELQEAWDAKDQARAEIVLRLHTTLRQEIVDAKRYMFKDGIK